jgi:hypothetical protein
MHGNTRAGVLKMSLLLFHYRRKMCYPKNKDRGTYLKNRQQRLTFEQEKRG